MVTIIHHRQTSGPTETEHAKLSHMLRPRNPYTCLLGILIYFLISCVREMIAIISHKFKLMLKFRWQPQIVRVKKRNPSPFCPTQRIVASDGRTRILGIALILYTLIRLHIGFNHLQRVIGRAIVLNKQFPILVSLCLYTFDRFCYKSNTRPSRRYNRYQSIILHNIFIF